MLSKIFLISVFLTVGACWIKAAESDTSLISFPSGINIFFWHLRYWRSNAWPHLNPVDTFSPKKFEILTRDPLFWITMLMGKWVYTGLIVKQKASVMPFDHVLCVTTDSAKGSQFLSISLQFVNAESLLFLSKETFCILSKDLVVSWRGCSDFMQPYLMCNSK